jgi:ribosomal protein S18
MTNYQLGRGQLFRKCLSYSPCKTLYFQKLQQVSAWATDSNLSQRMLDTAALIKKFTTSYSKAEQKRTSAWVGKQQARIEKAIAKNCELNAAGLVELCR